MTKKILKKIAMLTLLFLTVIVPISCGTGGGGGGSGGGGGGGSDTTSPTVLSTNPDTGDKNVLNTSISATFSEAMDASTINDNTFILKINCTTEVTGTVTYDSATFAATLTLSSLDTDTQYNARITTGAQDAAGNALTENYIWDFATASTTTPPCP